MNEAVSPVFLSANTYENARRLVADIEARATKHTTPCGNGSVVWRRWGDGPAVFLLHGGSGSWLHWIRNVLPLSERYTVWVPDLPGFGDSDPPEETTIESIAGAAEHGLRTLVPEHEPIDLVGFSFGSMLSALIGTRLGHRVRNAVLTGGRFSWYSKPATVHLVSWRKLTDPAERMAAHRRNLELMMMADPKNIDALAVYLQAQSAEHARVSTRKAKPAPAEKMREYLPRLRAQGQVVIILGRQDTGAQTIANDVPAAEQALYPGARFHIIENAGHWVAFEAAEQVNAILFDVLGPGGAR